MAKYDAICVLSPGLAEEKIDALILKFEKKIKDGGGEVEKTEKWGMRKLQFVFKKHKGFKDGFFLLIKFSGEGKSVSALRDIFRIQEEVIRHIITCVVEEVIPGAEEAVVFPEMIGEQAGGQS